MSDAELFDLFTEQVLLILELGFVLELHFLNHSVFVCRLFRNGNVVLAQLRNLLLVLKVLLLQRFVLIEVLLFEVLDLLILSCNLLVDFGLQFFILSDFLVEFDFGRSDFLGHG